MENLNVLYSAEKEHLFSELKSEGVILSLKNGKYYGVNEVGVTIWKLIQTPSAVDEIEAKVVAEYDVDLETCREEVANFIRDMSEEGLIKVSYAEPS